MGSTLEKPISIYTLRTAFRVILLLFIATPAFSEPIYISDLPGYGVCKEIPNGQECAEHIERKVLPEHRFVTRTDSTLTISTNAGRCEFIDSEGKSYHFRGRILNRLYVIEVSLIEDAEYVICDRKTGAKFFLAGLPIPARTGPWFFISTFDAPRFGPYPSGIQIYHLSSGNIVPVYEQSFPCETWDAAWLSPTEIELNGRSDPDPNCPSPVIIIRATTGWKPLNYP